MALRWSAEVLLVLGYKHRAPLDHFLRREAKESLFVQSPWQPETAIMITPWDRYFRRGYWSLEKPDYNAGRLSRLVSSASG